MHPSSNIYYNNIHCYASCSKPYCSTVSHSCNVHNILPTNYLKSPNGVLKYSLATGTQNTLHRYVKSCQQNSSQCLHNKPFASHKVSISNFFLQMLQEFIVRKGGFSAVLNHVLQEQVTIPAVFSDHCKARWKWSRFIQVVNK